MCVRVCGRVEVSVCMGVPIGVFFCVQMCGGGGLTGVLYHLCNY